MTIGRKDIDFIKENTSEEDIDLFLGPVSENQDQRFDSFENKTLAHLMAEAGVFPSVGQAKKNGWNKPIPLGFSHFIVGKKKSSVAILNTHD